MYIEYNNGGLSIGANFFFFLRLTALLRVLLMHDHIYRIYSMHVCMIPVPYVRCFSPHGPLIFRSYKSLH